MVDCFGKSRSAGFGRHFCFLAVFRAFFASFLEVGLKKVFWFSPLPTGPLGLVGGEERTSYRRLLGRPRYGQRGFHCVSPVFKFFPDFPEKLPGEKGTLPSAVSARAERGALPRPPANGLQGQYYRTTLRSFCPLYSAAYETCRVLRVVSAFYSELEVRHLLWISPI